MAVKKDVIYVPVQPFVTEERAYGMDSRVSGAWLAKKVAELGSGFADLWKPLELSFPEVEKATAAPGEKRGEEG